MAFAIFYCPSDAEAIAADVNRTDLAPADRAFASSLWGAGLNTWQSFTPAPPGIHGGPVDPQNPAEDSACIIVIDGRHQGQTITLAQLRSFLYRLGATAGHEYMLAIADDMGGISGAAEPWPEV